MGWHDWRVQESLEEEDDGSRSSLDWKVTSIKSRCIVGDVVGIAYTFLAVVLDARVSNWDGMSITTANDCAGGGIECCALEASFHKLIYSV